MPRHVTSPSPRNGRRFLAPHCGLKTGWKYRVQSRSLLSKRCVKFEPVRSFVGKRSGWLYFDGQP